MYSEPIVIPKVNGCFQLGEDVVLWKPDLLEIFGKSEAIYNGKAVNVHCNNKELLVEVNFEGDKVLVSEEGVKDKWNSGLNGVQIFLDSGYLHTSFNSDYSNSYLSFYDVSLKQNMWSMPFEGVENYYVEKGKVLLVKDEEISIVELLKGARLFNIPFAQLGIARILYVGMDKIVFLNQDSYLRALNIDNYDLVESWGQRLSDEEINIIRELTFFSSSEDYGQIVAGIGSVYIEIDLSSGDLKLFDFKEQLESNKILSIKQIKDCCVFDNSIFITANSYPDRINNKDVHCIFMIDLITKRIVWKHDFVNTGVGTNTPIIIDSDLYLLDVQGDLHVFRYLKKMLFT